MTTPKRPGEAQHAVAYEAAINEALAKLDAYDGAPNTGPRVPMSLAVDDAFRSAGERMRGMMTLAEDVGPSLNALSGSRGHRRFLARILDEQNVMRATRESRIANEQLLRHANERARRGRDMHIAHWIGAFS